MTQSTGARRGVFGSALRVGMRTAHQRGLALVVDESLRLNVAYEHTITPLSDFDARMAQQQARSVVRARDPMLAHMLEFKIARDGCSNYINARMRKELVHAVFTAREADLLFVFIPSEKLEPVVTVIALAAATGKVQSLTTEQVAGLRRAVVSFEQHFGVAAVDYYYTPPRARLCRDAPMCQRPHSTHFHVKIGVSGDVFRRLLPITQAFQSDALRDAAYLAYHAARVPLTWVQLERALVTEACGSDL